MIKLRPYQEIAVEKLRESFRSNKRAPILVMPTGAGKTFVFCYIAEQIAKKNKTAMILVHRAELIDQASKSLRSLGVDHSINREPIKPISIHGVQTLVNRTHELTAPDLLIVDECHRSVSKTYVKIFEAFSSSKILGVTATPCRTDGKPLKTVFDDMIFGPSVRDLINLGNLCDFKIYAPPIGVSLDGVSVRGGDYAKNEIEKITNKPQITGDAIEHFKKLIPDKQTLVFCAGVNHAEAVAEAYRNAGFRAECVHGGTHHDFRKSSIEKLASGEIQILTSSDLIGEGFDCPNVGAVQMLRPTQSFSLYRQQVGRALRPASQKSQAIILDHVGNTMRHGFPDDEIEFSLDGEIKHSGRRDEAGELLKISQCKICFAYFETGADSCPFCFSPIEIKIRKIKQTKGELQELKRQEIERKKTAGLEAKKARTFEELLAIEKKMGYKNGWAKLRFQHKKNRR